MPDPTPPHDPTSPHDPAPSYDPAPPHDPTPETPIGGKTPDPEPSGEPSRDALEVERLNVLVAEKETELDGMRHQIDFAVGRYRIALMVSAPDLPEELIRGNTIVELDDAMESAKKIVEKVASRIGGRTSEDRVPSGAPARREADLSGLSAREKILYAINKS